MRVIFLLSILAAFCGERAQAQVFPKPELRSGPLLQPLQAQMGTAPDTAGWRFITRPVCEAVDTKSGEVRFRIMLDKEGVIQSVIPVSSTVSARQEALCRQALLQSRFERIGATRAGATGYYTFRFSIR